MAAMLLACTPGAGPGAARPGAASPPRTAAPTTAVSGPCLAAQAAAGAPGVQSSLPVLVMAADLPTAEDLLMDGERLLIGQYSSGRISALGDQPEIHQLPGTVPTVEGMARLGGVLYVADQRNDRVVRLADDGTVTPFLQLSPVRGVDGVDGIATDGRSLIVPDSARGTVLWVGADGAVQRTVGGFARPTGAWPVPDGSVLVADENGGRVYSVGPDGSRSVLASGLPLADDVARTADGRVYAISITRSALVEVAGGSSREVAGGLAQPQGLELDRAGNPVVTEYDRGRVDKVVTGFALLPAGAPVQLDPGRPLCVQVARADGNADAVEIEPGSGYRVIAQPGVGGRGEVLPAACGRSECAVRVTVRTGERTDSAWLRYRGGT